ncbi:AAA family ATPase [Hassallia byssoidea VB512170]|uniref:AAA family ATPase n=1 Tax=Hassallia byssoidea VB512170 TaxID=1304833 RepID=A0A846HG66_9CYAN|nr:AAA family ATPase [Hassalia byssoidea]NEU75644.1 AAA family ATPase [Hassalia byssoidea VB512170]
MTRQLTHASKQSENQHSLQRLIRAIALSKNQFALILVRCNYQQLRTSMLEHLRFLTKDINLREIFLQPSTTALHTTIVSELFLDNPIVATDSLPSAVMISGLESVIDLEDLLTNINQARDIYATSLPFPLVLWLQDEVATSLSRLAPDFKSWAATTIKFEMAAYDLITLVQQETEFIFAKVLEAGAEKFLSNAALNLARKSQHRREIESARNDLQRLYNVTLEPELEASLEFVLGRDEYADDQIDNALIHYQKSLALWKEARRAGEWGSGGVGDREDTEDKETRRQGDKEDKEDKEETTITSSSPSSPSSPPSPPSPTPPLPIPPFPPTPLRGDPEAPQLGQAVVLFHLGLCYRRMADLYPTLGKTYWQDALLWFKQCLEVLETAQRKDLVAKFILPALDMLQRLQAWEELQQLAEKSLQLHETYGTPAQVAQDYGFLADVAASKSNWLLAHELANKALSISENAADVSRQQESWYLLLLARTQRHLGECEEAINNLEWARVVCEVQYEPSLYLQILEQLRSLYFFGRHDYTEAFSLKQEKIQIEHQYGFRAFIGPSQLQSQRYRINPVLEPQKRPFNQSGLAQEIAASGRQQDINRLIERISRADCKLTVIHGPSGVGKSSILKAGLVPVLKEKVIGERIPLPIVLSVYTDWLTALRRTINEALVQTELSIIQENSSSILLEKIRLLAERNHIIVIILDQMEELFFINKHPQKIREFYNLFSECLNISFVKIIISLREDYLHYLLEFERLSQEKQQGNFYDLGIINKNILDKNIRYYLGNFSSQDAISIIHSLTQRSHYELTDELIHQLVEDLAGELDEVHPIELQIVGAQLQAENITTLEQYKLCGGSKKLVQRWLEEVIKDCGQENEQLSWKLLFELTDEKGTRPLKTKADLVTVVIKDNELSLKSGEEEFPVEIEEVESEKDNKKEEITPLSVSMELILDILVGSGLVLRIWEESGDRYQLVHDYLVEPIRQKNDYGMVAELEKVRFEKTRAEVAQKLSQEQLNLVLHRRLREARIAGLSLFIMLGTIATLWWQADSQKRAAVLQTLRAERSESNFKISALTATSEALFASNKEFDALLESLRAWQRLKIADKIQPDTRMRVVTALQQAVYGVTEVNRLEGHADIVWGITFSPDGQLLASGSRDKTVKLWRPDGTLLQTLKGHSDAVSSVSFSPDGQTLASSSLDKTVLLWHRNPTNGEFDPQPYKTLKGHGDWVYSVNFSPDGELLATGSKDATIKLWRRDGTLVKILKGHKGWVNWVTFSPDGKFIASASDDKTVKIWHRDGSLVTTLSGHEKGVTVVDFSPDGQLLASAGRDKKVMLWRRGKSTQDVLKFRPYRILRQHTSPVWSLSFSDNGQQLASGSDDNTINVWSVRGTLLKTLKGHSDAVAGVAFSPDNKILASASYDKSVKLWSLNPPRLPILTGHKDRVLSVAWSADGKILASGSRDRTVKLWQRESTSKGVVTRLYKTLLGHTDRVASVTFDPKGQMLASASYDKTVKLWQRDGSLLHTLQGHSNSVMSVSFSPDGQLLASASKDKTIKLWNRDGSLLKTLKGHQGWVNSVNFSPDGRVIASASDDQTVKLWRRDGTLLKSFLPHESWVLGVSFSPTDRLLASASWDNTVKLWRWDGTLLKTLLRGYSDSVNAVTFSPNGELLASASWDSSVKLWSHEGKLIKTLNGHTGAVLSVSFSPQGNTLASASDDNTIILWNLDLDDLLLRGCSWMSDYLKHNHNVEERDRHMCDDITQRR